jgi:hypothetical protein
MNTNKYKFKVAALFVQWTNETDPVRQVGDELGGRGKEAGQQQGQGRTSSCGNLMIVLLPRHILFRFDFRVNLLPLFVCFHEQFCLEF